MLIGLGDGGRARGKKGCKGCGGAAGEREKRRATALRQLEAAHAGGALAGLGELGDVASDTWPSTGAINTETASLATSVAQLGRDIFDGFGRDSYPVDDPGVGALQNAWNAFLADFNQWQASAYFWNPSRRDELISYRARFNALLAQWRAVPSVVTVAAPVAGAEPAKGGLAEAVDHVEAIVKWGALIVGGAMALKVASDLGVFAKLGGLIKGGRSSAGGGASRRYGSARL